MLIKAAVHENCGECGRIKKEVSPEEYGCDKCRKPIVPYGNDERLDITVFHNDQELATDHFYFCSWRCVFSFAKKIKTDHFFTLPYVSCDNKIEGRRAQDFMWQIRSLGK